MRNNDLIETAVCAQYTPEQLHKLAAHYYTADEIASAAAKIIVEPGEDGTAPDPVEIAEETLCAALFHTFDGWKSPRNGGLSVKRGEKAVIRCKLWKYKDSPKPEDLPADADPLTRAASRLTIWPALPKRSRPSAKRTTTCPLSLLRFPGAPCPALSRPNLNSPVFVGFSIMK